MKILYDHQAFAYFKFGGIARYFYELMRYYDRSETADFELALPANNDNEYLKCSPAVRRWLSAPGVPPRSGFVNRCRRALSRRLRPDGGTVKLVQDNRAVSAMALSRGGFDVLHPTYYDPYFLKLLGKKPFVLTVHDCIHEIFPEMLMEDPAYLPKKRLAEKAARIIAVSRQTKEDLMRIYGIEEKKITVVHHGNALDPNAGRGDLILPKRYLLYVGNRTLYKNFYFFARAAAAVMRKETDLRLVCLGGREFTELERKFFQVLDVENRVHCYPADDAALVQAYRNAVAFAYPSLYEGFGIPLLEAFACGCPVICSGTSCFPEVADGAALYFDPKDFDGIKEVISEVLTNERRREELRDAGYRRLRHFSLEKCARETLEVYKNVT